jgi:hypothetical protein
MMHLDQAIAALRFDPQLPIWLLAVLAGFCASALGIALWRRARGAAWRGVLFAVVLLWLAGPRLVEESRQTRPDIGLLVIDQTASMQVGDRTKLAEQARAAIEAQLHDSGRELEGLELRTVTLPEGGNGGTKLFAAIDRALADIPASRLAGIIAVTDGQVHDIPVSPPGGAPLHILLPAKGEETDRRVRIVSAPGYGIVGKSAALRVVVEDLGVARPLLAPAAMVNLTVRRDGEPPQIVQVPVGQPTNIDIPITRAGPIVVEMAAEKLAGAVSDINNRAVVTINGVRDRLRVLLVSGEPHPGERTWRRLLKADPAVDLVHFTILRPPEKDDLTPLNELALIAFPTRELFQIKIREFDLIILDRFTNRGLLPPIYLRNIAEYVRQGGALLVSAGPEFAGVGSPWLSPLSTVLPAHAVMDALGSRGVGITEQAFRPAVTPLGTRHPVTADLPGWNANGPPAWGEWYRAMQSTNIQGDVLMTGPKDQPLLVVNHVGEGRVALLLSDQIWLWSRGHDGGGPQAELLRRVAHWLMKEPELDETALTASVEGGVLSVERRFTEAAPPGNVTVTSPEGEKRVMALEASHPGRGTIRLPATLPGVWQVSDGSHVAYAAAGAANPMELADLRATATKLAALVKQSGGSIHWLDPDGAPILQRTDPGRTASGSGWIGMVRRDDHIVTGIAALPLLPAGLALPLILGLAVLAWRREGG